MMLNHVVPLLLGILVWTMADARDVRKPASSATRTRTAASPPIPEYYQVRNPRIAEDRSNRKSKNKRKRDLQEEQVTETPTVSPTISGSEGGTPTVSMHPTATFAPTSNATYGILGTKSSKSDKSSKSTKSTKSSDDSSSDSESSEEDDDSREDDNGNSTSAPTHASSPSKSSKSSKSAKSTESTKSTKSTKSQSTKSQKSSKSGSTDSDDSDEQGPTPSPAPDDSNAFTAQIRWRTNLYDVVGTGQIVYDPKSTFAYYAYTADTFNNPIVIAKQATTPTTTTTSTTTSDIDMASITTVGRVCAVDVANGKVMSPCQDIEPRIGTATSTQIEAVEACYDDQDNNGSIVAVAVIVSDTVNFLQFTNVVGARVIVYPIGMGGTATTRAAPIDVAYEGWSSLYGEPGVSGRPAFSYDCQTLYSTYITNPKFGESSTTTVAMSIGNGDNGKELWRQSMDDYRRFVGFAASKDGRYLYSATNAPDDEMSGGSMAQLDATTGRLLQEYFYDDDLLHNAYANVVLDENGDTYHIDSAFGLVKFDGSNLNKGPVWKSRPNVAEISIRKRRRLQRNRELRPRSPKSDKILSVSVAQGKSLWYDESANDSGLPTAETAAMAYRPALASNGETVYGGNKKAVAALGAQFGESVWKTTVVEGNMDLPNVITDDISFGPSRVSRSGSGIYVASGAVVQCYSDSDGGLLWSYHLNGETRTKSDRNTEHNSADEIKNDSRVAAVPSDDEQVISRIEVIDSESVLVAASGGMLLRLHTTLDPVPTPGVPNPPVPSPFRPTERPTPSPTIRPTEGGQAPPTADPRSNANPMPSQWAAAFSIMTMAITICFSFVNS
mmetsp:Transcript_9670/g.17001  ORF Transcript_9670/g.17001 Transcript_9670/m.17001 type:complete len:838 (-) Transcript_9670:106-2619(-)